MIVIDLSLSTTMSKREGEPTRLPAAKVKKRRGVRSRAITVPDSDEEESYPTTSNEYAWVTKTRVAALSGKAESISVGSIPIFEVDQPCEPVLEHENPDDFADIDEINVPAAAPSKRRKKVNDSVSTQLNQLPYIADASPD